jgi:hypothetical protein
MKIYVPSGNPGKRTLKQSSFLDDLAAASELASVADHPALPHQPLGGLRPRLAGGLPRPPLLRPGVDFVKLHFGRKVCGQIFFLRTIIGGDLANLLI